MTEHQKKWLIRATVLLTIALLGIVVWQRVVSSGRNKDVVSGNGRIEAVEIDVAARSAGRIKDILVHEGDFVTSGQVVAIMDVEVLQAQLRQAQAQQKQAQASVTTARSQMAQRESEKEAVLALVKQREAEQENARKHAARSSQLLERKFISRQDADDDSTLVQSTAAAVSAARAQVAAAEANIATARAQVAGAESA